MEVNYIINTNCRRRPEEVILLVFVWLRADLWKWCILLIVTAGAGLKKLSLLVFVRLRAYLCK